MRVAVLVFVLTVPWTCAWIRHAASRQPNGWRKKMKKKLGRLLKIMGKNGLLFRLQRRLLLAGRRMPLLEPDSLQNSSHTPSKLARRARTRQLAPFGRMSVISFHSLEDRIVKQFFASKVKVEQPDRRLPIRYLDLPQPQMRLLNRIKPSEAEVTENPRSRSAILRVSERLPEGKA